MKLIPGILEAMVAVLMTAGVHFVGVIQKLVYRKAKYNEKSSGLFIFNYLKLLLAYLIHIEAQINESKLK